MAALADDIARIRQQEEALVFDGFDEEAAFRLGTLLRERARAEALPVVVEVLTWDRKLFFCALPGSNEGNVDWVRRKVNVVRRFSRSSYRVALEQDAPDGLLAPRHGVDGRDYALAGGAFPIRLANAGVIGAVAVSGLPQRADHALVVEAICAFLGRDPGELALPQD